MRTKPLLIAAFLSVFLAGALQAAPIKRRHKPWMGSSPPGVAVTPSTPPLEKGRRGGISPQQIPPNPPSVKGGKDAPGNQIVQQAARYRGTRYKFGGTTQRGMDCSGLVQRVWQDLKIGKLPRASSALYDSGRPVRLVDLRAGDLVFFKNTYKRGISHVGVYAGRNKFIHASSSRGVTVTRLSDPYYQLRYAGARRLY